MGGEYDIQGAALTTDIRSHFRIGGNDYFFCRESDYGVVTRDFESNADEMVLAAVLAATQAARNTTPKPPTLSPAAVPHGAATDLKTHPLHAPTSSTALSSVALGDSKSDVRPASTTKSEES